MATSSGSGKVSTHFRPRKADPVARAGRDGSCGSDRTAVFPSGFLQSFAFKAEEAGSSRLEQTEQHRRNEGRGRKRAREDKEDKSEEEERECLLEVPDHIKEDVDILFIGSNPGRMSSRKSRHFAHPSNHFYRALHQSNLTPVQVSPNDDYKLLSQPEPYLSLGLTNLVARPTRMAQDLAKSEEALGAEILLNLIRRNRPKLAVFVGLGVARSFERCMNQSQAGAQVKKEEAEAEEEAAVMHIRVAKEVPLVSDKQLGLGVGLMAIAIRHSTDFTLLYAMPSTSGRVTSHQLKDKTACMTRARMLTSQLAKGPDDAEVGSLQAVQIRLV